MGNNEEQKIQNKSDFKRLNVDISLDLFRVLKHDCYNRGITVSDFIRGLLMERF